MFNDMSGGSTRRVRFFAVAVVGSEGGGCSHFLFLLLPAHFTYKRGGSTSAVRGCCGVPQVILPPGGKDAPPGLVLQGRPGTKATNLRDVKGFPVLCVDV